MSLLHRFLATGAPALQTYVDDVFSAYTRTGTGASATITTGINLSSLGGLVWTKGRSGATDHKFTDTVRGVQKALVSNTTAAQTTDTNGLTAFGTTGHTIGSDSTYNTNGATYVDWVFAKAPKFFDVVTYTGDGNSGRSPIPHSLACTPGFLIMKSTSATGDWNVVHRGSNGTTDIKYGNGLNLTNALITIGSDFSAYFNASTFSPSVWGSNVNGVQYVAYLFAHDTSATGLIQCGSFVSSGGVDTINLGFEPQFLIYKSSSNISDWRTIDVTRGWSMSSNTLTLFPNLSNAEQDASVNGNPTATGFSFNTGATISGATYIYLAIRRPNKPPTLGTQVYNAIARTGTGAAATVTGVGFAPDLFINDSRSGTTGPWFEDRLRGATLDLTSASAAAETTVAQAVTAFNMDGASIGTNSNWNTNAATYINWFFKRAPNTMDEICFTGTGANTTQAHNLAVAPELWVVKSRNGTTQWVWGSSLLAATEKIVMPTVNGRVTDATVWNSTYPTSTVLSLGTSTDVNNNNVPYVGYLWATTAGVSKVGTYTGNGSSQTINCGFTTGARFVMIIRATASTAQDIYLWDSTRGIVAATDPRLSLNTTAAEVTTLDTVDANTSGFIVNTDASNVNVNGAVYLYLSYA